MLPIYDFYLATVTNVTYSISPTSPANNSLEIWRNISTITSTCVSILSLCIVVYFTISDRRKKIKQDEIDQKAFWYRDIILKKNIDILYEIFDEFIITIEESYQNPNVHVKMLEDFQKKKRKVILVLNDQIRIINKYFADDLDDELDFFEDKFTHMTEELFTSSTNQTVILDQTIKMITDKRNNYHKQLYLFEINGYKHTLINDVIDNEE